MTTFRGHPCCTCQPVWLPVLEAEAQRQGLITGPLPISQLIGGDPRSGGTHLGGGEADFYPLTAISDVTAFVRLCRDMGADATWHRPFNWDGANGVEHVHSGLTGCPHNVQYAGYQLTAVRAGFNGLGHLGHGAPDDGPKPLSGRTWEQGIEWAKAQEDIVTPDDIEKIAQRTAELVLAADVDKDGKVSVKQALNQIRNAVAKVAGKS